MPLYRYSIEPLSAFGTPLRSDTLYGHLLWAAAQSRCPSRVSLRRGVPQAERGSML